MTDKCNLNSKIILDFRLPSSRLAWAAGNLVYGNYGGRYDRPLFGPQPTRVERSRRDDNSSVVYVEFSAELAPVYIEEDRFMVCCLDNVDMCDQVPYGEGWQGEYRVSTVHKYYNVQYKTVNMFI